ncbi:ABC transporter permease subunit [bacterium]|nr:ABC transporter permease subunit [bacterium]
MAAPKHSLLVYCLKRLMLMVPTFVGVTLCVFVLCQFVPGGPIDQLIMSSAGASDGGEGGGGGGRRTVSISDKDLAAMKAYYNFDKPIHLAYYHYVKNLVTLDLGTSFRYTRPVKDVIFQRLPISIYYGLVTTILTYAVCIPLGVLKAIRHRTWLDTSTSVLIFIGYAIPGFALGALLLSVLAVNHQIFPLAGFKGPDFDKLSTLGKVRDVVWHSILPVFCYMIGGFALMTMLVKNSLLENLAADYVRTAMASGLSWRRAVVGHALRNSLIPLATSFGNNIALLLAGSLLIERVFTIPGMGLLFYESITARDYPVVMGLTVISALLMLVGNLLSDLCVAAVDPRVRFN